MFLTEAPEAWQFFFPALCAQSGGKHETTHMGSPKLPEDCLLFKSYFALPVNFYLPDI